MVRNENFHIEYEKTDNEIHTSLFIANEVIGVPLICNDLSNEENYHTDLALFILCITSKTNDDLIQKKYRDFIKDKGIIS